MSAGASHQGRSPKGAARATLPSAPPPGPPPTTPPPANVVDRIAMLIASFGMTGFFPVAPATFASAITAVGG
jgi:hypothetical protein